MEYDPFLNYLCAIWADPVQSSNGAVQEPDDFQEVFVPDTPGAIDQEDQVCFGCLTNWSGEKNNNNKWVHNLLRCSLIISDNRLFS